MVSVVLTFPLDFGHTNIKYNTKTTKYVLVIKSKARLKSLKQIIPLEPKTELEAFALEMDFFLILYFQNFLRKKRPN